MVGVTVRGVTHADTGIPADDQEVSLSLTLGGKTASATFSDYDA